MFFHVGFSTPGTCWYTCRPINKQIFPCQQLGFLVEEVWHPKGSPGLICLLAESCWYACLGLQTHLWHFQWKFGCSGMGRREQDLQELMTADVSWCVQCPMLNRFQDVSRQTSWCQRVSRLAALGRRKVERCFNRYVCVCAKDDRSSERLKRRWRRGGPAKILK